MTLTFIGRADGAARLPGSADSYVIISQRDYPTCEGNPIIIDAAAFYMGPHLSYVWRVNGLIQPNQNSSSLVIDNVNVKVALTDIVDCVVTDNDSGQAITSNQLTNVVTAKYYKPSAQIYFMDTFSGGERTICPDVAVAIGTSTSFNYNLVPVSLQYQWLINGQPIDNKKSFLENYPYKDGDKVVCNVIMISKCLARDSAISNEITIHLNPTPAITISSADGGCAGTTQVYKATVTNPGTAPAYEWMINGGKAGTNSATFTSSTLKTNDVITCKFTTKNFCGNAEALSNPVVVADITAVKSNTVSISSSAPGNFITEGQTVYFTANPTYQGNLSYQWFVNGKASGYDGPTFLSSTLTIGDKVYCVATATENCVVPRSATSNVITILMHKPIIVPNAFTPNGDGINDTWDLLPLLAYPDCNIRVFNRYGALVYQSIGYTQGWDGTLNGKPLPVGVYYYIIKPGGQTPPFSGSVSIIR
ncbi:gliding motility-associated C-terminal domain-containing protein [Mucilaginibacter sp. RS28]|uniref:Gliding motility-associated C-terminal domain-containing protein n=1 Tax=Mucilaginibacter straminoryzae TaxID=2932774 RepID=A0A9X2BBR4_9SPHI|nr:gliding motility-associated C-terminal domain-containing protein [Mucilaginibacter straminoryzae]MCJ8211980.1 gliding motility-associated C-terminal domain-containing protein [Mucilaginibacter straminoryzae]